jgi:hypothetical protein
MSVQAVARGPAPPQPSCRPPGGLRCPKCGGPEHHCQTTRYRPGATRRVRVCLACGHRFRTREVLESSAAWPPRPRPNEVQAPVLLA